MVTKQMGSKTSLKYVPNLIVGTSLSAKNNLTKSTITIILTLTYKADGAE